MTRARAVFAWALLGAALAASAERPRSLYASPARSAEPAVSEESPPAPTAAMEEKFRKLQKEMEASPSAAPAAGPAAGTRAPRNEGVSAGGLALKILFGLAFVLLLAVVAIRALKRVQGGLLSRTGRTGRTGPGGDMLEVLETCHLGPQQKVIAMRMHDEIGVLGVTKDGIRLLTVLKRPADEIRQARHGESNPAAFSDNLNKLLDRFKKPKKVSDMLDEAEA